MIDNKTGWYIVRLTDDAICAGPYNTRLELRSSSFCLVWFMQNPMGYDVVYGTIDPDFHSFDRILELLPPKE